MIKKDILFVETRTEGVNLTGPCFKGVIVLATLPRRYFYV